jgi:hypothetical protein
MRIDAFPPKVARSVISDVIDAAMNHIYFSQMVGIESESANDLEEALSRMPCLYCGVVGFAHDNDCPRHAFRNKQFFKNKRGLS